MEKHDAMWGVEAGAEIASLHAEIERLLAVQTEIETIARVALDEGDRSDWGLALGKVIHRCGNKLARAVGPLIHGSSE